MTFDDIEEMYQQYQQDNKDATEDPALEASDRFRKALTDAENAKRILFEIATGREELLTEYEELVTHALAAINSGKHGNAKEHLEKILDMRSERVREDIDDYT